MKKKRVRKVKLTENDLAYIRGMTQKTRRPSNNLDNAVPEISLVHGIVSLYEERVAPPHVFVPLREYNQKNDETPLPAENIQSGFRSLSMRAKLAWDKWTNPEGMPFIEDNVEYYPLQGDVVKWLLDESEQKTYEQYQKDVAEDEDNWQAEVAQEIHAVTSVTPNFVHCQSGVIKRDPYNRTYADYMDNVNKSDYETNRWRPPARKEELHLIPNCGFKDDPDYIPPISNSGNFRLSPPASRMFDASFSVFLKSGKKLSFVPSLPKGQKDYSDVNDIMYLLEQKGMEKEVEKITVDFARYEVDLRVTFAEGPDPRNYKKVDPQSNVGIKLMGLLNDQPHLWTEYAWDYVDHEDKVSKKVAYGLTFGKDNKATYWIYLDDRYVKTGRSILSSRKPVPNISYKTIKDQEGNHIPIMAFIVFHKMHAGMKASLDFIQDKEDKDEKVSKFVIENMKLKLEKDGYRFIKETEDEFGLVSQLFLRKDALTKKARDKFVLSEIDWHKKYGAS